MAKDFAEKFYKSKKWQNCRNEYAKKAHHLCEQCLANGLFKTGEIVHHKIELTPTNIDNPEITLNFDNLELLCRECHAKEHDLAGGLWGKINKERKEAKAKKKRYSVDENGTVICR